jgi:hypothetical protein
VAGSVLLCLRCLLRHLQRSKDYKVALMHIQYGVPVDTDQVMNSFVIQHTSFIFIINRVHFYGHVHFTIITDGCGQITMGVVS